MNDYINEQLLNAKLIEASSKGDLLSIKELVANGADISYRDNKILHNACENNQIEILKYLIEQDVDLNDIGFNTNIVVTPLVRASLHGNIEIVKLLVENGADIYMGHCKAILYSLEAEKFNVFNYLVNALPDLNKAIELMEVSIDKSMTQDRLNYMKKAIEAKILYGSLSANLSEENKETSKKVKI